MLLSIMKLSLQLEHKFILCLRMVKEFSLMLIFIALMTIVIIISKVNSNCISFHFSI